MDTVAVSDLLSGLPKQGRQDRFIHRVLQGLASEGHERVEKLNVPSWTPILVPGDAGHLYLVLTGNASIAFSKGGLSVARFSKILDGIPQRKNPVTELNEAAETHPLVLCKGDLIGEFEYVQKRDPMSHVIAGTFFKAPETRKRLQTTLIRLPARSAFAATASLHAMTEKLWLLNHLLLPSIHRRQARINHILACCFAGLFPVYRAFYTSDDGNCEIHIPDSCSGTPEERTEETYACLGRLDPTRTPVGIEISTSYLMRCFGFASTQAITMDVDGHELDCYSDAVRLTKYKNVNHLGSESLLFFLRRKTAHEFCSEYGVDLQHMLLGEALAAIS